MQKIEYLQHCLSIKYSDSDNNGIEKLITSEDIPS